MRTNAEQLVEVSVYGEVWPPTGHMSQYKATSEGRSTASLGMAGICYSARVGDRAFGWEADHLEPGVSIRSKLDGPEHAQHNQACMGNKAVITSGLAASGAVGIVTGGTRPHHDRLPAGASLERLAVGDRIQIRSYGTGLKLLDHPEVRLHKCSPRLIEALNLTTNADGTLSVPVVTEIPTHLMGSGAELMADYVDQDFMTNDRAEIERLGLDKLRLGDIVAVRDQDHTWGRGYYAGAVTIGLIIHGDSAWTGHGPGVLDLLTSRGPAIVPVLDPEANIAWRMGILSKNLQSTPMWSPATGNQLVCRIWISHAAAWKGEDTDMLRDNRAQLITVSVQGQVSSPEYASLPASPYLIGADGLPELRPSPGWASCTTCGWETAPSAGWPIWSSPE